MCMVRPLTPATKRARTPRGRTASPSGSTAGPLGRAPVPEQLARKHAYRGHRVAAVAAQNRAVDDDGVDAGGFRDEAVRPAGEIPDATQGTRTDRRRIEHDDIGGLALGKPAAIGDAEDLGGPRGQHADRFFERERLLLAHPSREEIGPLTGI